MIHGSSLCFVFVFVPGRPSRASERDRAEESISTHILVFLAWSNDRSFIQNMCLPLIRACFLLPEKACSQCLISIIACTPTSSMTETASTTSTKATEAAAAVAAGSKEEQVVQAAATPTPLDTQPTLSTASSPSEEGGETGDSSKSSPGLSPSTWKPNAAAAEWTPSFGAPAAAPSPVAAMGTEAVEGGGAMGGAKETGGEGKKVWRLKENHPWFLRVVCLCCLTSF